MLFQSHALQIMRAWFIRFCIQFVKVVTCSTHKIDLYVHKTKASSFPNLAFAAICEGLHILKSQTCFLQPTNPRCLPRFVFCNVLVQDPYNFLYSLSRIVLFVVKVKNKFVFRICVSLQKWRAKANLGKLDPYKWCVRMCACDPCTRKCRQS